MSTPMARERDHNKAASNSRRLVSDQDMASLQDPRYYEIRMRLCRKGAQAKSEGQL